jgi:hypothetical protein
MAEELQDLVIPQAFAVSKLPLMVELWSDGYSEYVETETVLAAKEEREPVIMEAREFAVMKVREFLHAATERRFKQKQAREAEQFNPHE